MYPQWINLFRLPDIDECQSSPCHGEATCIDQVDGYSCSCPDGYGGNSCEQGRWGIKRMQRCVAFVAMQQHIATNMEYTKMEKGTLPPSWPFCVFSLVSKTTPLVKMLCCSTSASMVTTLIQLLSAMLLVSSMFEWRLNITALIPYSILQQYGEIWQ